MTELHPSELDTRVFGFPVYRSYAQTAETLAHDMEEAEAGGGRLLIARLDVANVALMQKVLLDGFLLTDVQATFRMRLTEKHVALAEATLPARLAREGEEETLVEIARRSFEGKPSHYRSDARLDKDRCDELYAEAMRTFYRGRGERQKLLVVEREGSPVGVMVVRLPEEGAAEGSFGAIHPRARKEALAVYRSLVLRGMMLAWERRIVQGRVSTSIRNLVVHKVLARLGYEPTGYHYTLHYWFD